MSLLERQSKLVGTYRAIWDVERPHVLVGGWAVSAFQTRFTTDIDAVLPETFLANFEALLVDLDYEKLFEKDVSKQYEGQVVQYKKPVGENEVKFEALVNALRCRQTDAEWSYRYLQEHSIVDSLNVSEGLDGRIPEPALLFVLKLHSGRMVDTRDLVVISIQADFDRVERHLSRGNPSELDGQIEDARGRFEDDSFEDSFKGVFRQKEIPEDAVTQLVAFLRGQRERLT